MHPWKEEIRSQLRLATPIVLVQLGLMAMGAVDVAFMGRVSAVDYAAVSLGRIWTFTCIVFGMGLLTALDPIVSQAWGAKDERAIRRGLQRGLFLAMLVSIPVGLCIWPVELILKLFEQQPDVIPIATDYAQISILSVPAFLGFIALRQTLQAMHRLRPLLVVIFATNLLNVLLDWSLIFGHLGMPAMGARGAAWATVGSRWAMVVGLVLLGWPALGRYLRPLDRLALARAPLLRMVHIGLPIGLQFFLEIAAFSLIGFLMGRLGADDLAGHQVALTLASISFMIPLGISMAASVRVGNAVGRGDEPAARLASKVALVAGAGVMLGFGILFVSAPFPLARIMTNLDEVLVVAVLLIPIAGFFQVFDGIQVVASGVLRGVADTRIPMLIHVIGFWALGTPLACWFAFGLGHGAIGLWWGLVVGLGSVALIQLLRVRNRLSGSLTRVRIDEESAEAAPHEASQDGSGA